MAQSIILLASAAVLVLAIARSWWLRVDAACKRNTVPLSQAPAFWDATDGLDHVHVTLKSINSELERAHRGLDTLSAKTARVRAEQRHLTGETAPKLDNLPVREASTPKPGKKKAAREKR